MLTTKNIGIIFIIGGLGSLFILQPHQVILIPIGLLAVGVGLIWFGGKNVVKPADNKDLTKKMEGQIKTLEKNLETLKTHINSKFETLKFEASKDPNFKDIKCLGEFRTLMILVGQTSGLEVEFYKRGDNGNGSNNNKDYRRDGNNHHGRRDRDNGGDRYNPGDGRRETERNLGSAKN